MTLLSANETEKKELWNYRFEDVFNITIYNKKIENNLLK
jgi:hypothetical protein